MKISQKGLYGLQAMMMLSRHYTQGAIRIRDIAYEENLPEKFLELILLELKNARMVESVRGAKGGYRLRRVPSEIRLSEIIRLIDGPLAPFGDADQLRTLIDLDAEHRALYQVFLEVRHAAARRRVPVPRPATERPAKEGALKDGPLRKRKPSSMCCRCRLKARGHD